MTVDDITQSVGVFLCQQLLSGEHYDDDYYFKTVLKLGSLEAAAGQGKGAGCVSPPRATSMLLRRRPRFSST
ncbi:unnamed protein product [Boreogadus saida]